LKTKWGIFKHDVAMFIGNYTIVIALCEFGIGTKDMFQKDGFVQDGAAEA
jgi:hypothetical protein